MVVLSSWVVVVVNATTVDTVCRNPSERALKVLLIFRSGMGSHHVDRWCYRRGIIGNYVSEATLMRLSTRFTVMLMAASLLLPLSPRSLASGDHDLVREALESGEILPRQTITAKVEQIPHVQTLGVEPERDDGLWIHEIMAGAG